MAVGLIQRSARFLACFLPARLDRDVFTLPVFVAGLAIADVVARVSSL